MIRQDDAFPWNLTKTTPQKSEWKQHESCVTFVMSLNQPKTATIAYIAIAPMMMQWTTDLLNCSDNWGANQNIFFEHGLWQLHAEKISRETYGICRRDISRVPSQQRLQRTESAEWQMQNLQRLCRVIKLQWVKRLDSVKLKAHIPWNYKFAEHRFYRVQNRQNTGPVQTAAPKSARTAEHKICGIWNMCDICRVCMLCTVQDLRFLQRGFWRIQALHDYLHNGAFV